MQCASRSRLGLNGLPFGRFRHDGICQHGYDSIVFQKLAAAPFVASNSHSQRCQHDFNGHSGAHGVCRAHHRQMDAWRCTGDFRPAVDLQSSHSTKHTNSCWHTASATAAAATAGQCPGLERLKSSVVAAAAQAAAAVAADDPEAAPSPATSTRNIASSSSSNSNRGTSSTDSPRRRLRRSSSSTSPASSTSSSSSIEADSAIQQQQQQQQWQQPDSELGKYSYRMVISYDGTAYSGWQLQLQAPTVQAQVERALSTALRQSRRALSVCAAGRTDAGVHARGQVVQFFTNSTSIDPHKLPYKLNSLLPHDIRVQWVCQTAPDFNVTVSALCKTYHYHLDSGSCHDPLRVRYSYHCRRQLDLTAMQAAAALLVGTHDFTQFSNVANERVKRNPVKTIERFDVVVDGPAAVRLEVQGTGFLYKQVRHMSGALIAIGEGRLGLQDIVRRLEIGDTEPPGAGGLWRGHNVAPAKGLLLHEVQYPPSADDPTGLLYPSLPHDDYGRLLARIPGASSVDE